MDLQVPRDDAPAASASVGAALQSLLWTIAVLAATSAILRVADAVPGVLQDTPRGVVRYRAASEAEHAIGRRLPVLAYFPEALEWPPADLRVYLGRAAAYSCRSRADGSVALVVAVAPPGDGLLADDVLPPSAVLQEADGSVGGHAARITRLRDTGGALWQQIAWTGDRGVIVARYRGTLDELMRLASSLRE